MFRKFDTDFSTSISFDEFWNMLNYYSLAITRYEAIVLFKAFEDRPGFMSYEMFMRTFDRAEYTVNGGRSKTVADSSRELADSSSKEELDGMIDEVRALAKTAAYKANQELILGRIARSMKNSKTAQDVHENFRRFGEWDGMGWGGGGALLHCGARAGTWPFVAVGFFFLIFPLFLIH